MKKQYIELTNAERKELKEFGNMCSQLKK